MSELTDDQLDGLFRKSAEEFDPQFDPTAWQDMKSRLDNHDRTRPGGAANWKNVLPWGLAVLLFLLLTGGAWYVYQKTNTVNRSTKGSSNSISPLPKEKTAENGGQPESSRLATTSSHASPTGNSSKPEGDEAGRRKEEAERTANRAGLVAERNESKGYSSKTVNDAARTTATPTEPATERAPTSYKLTNTKRIPTHASLTSKPSTASRAEATTSRLLKSTVSINGISSGKGRKNRQAVRTFSVPDHAITATSSFTNRQIKKQRPTNSQASLINNNEVPATEAITDVSKPVIDLNELAIRPARWPQPLAFVGRPVTASPDTTSRKVIATSIVPRGLSIRFAIAPDLSTVGLKNFSRPGTNIGLLLEYRLASRWSVQAGIVRSMKVYDATAEQYGYWPDYINKWQTKPIGVEGACMIIDIPINIRYDAIIKPRLDNKLPSRWFVSTGITSYVMKQEDYTFKYTDYSHVNPPMLGESASTGGYGLSHVNISAGYERALNRRLSWQVEPFMKVPLKGVGYFKIDVISTGAFFSIRYKL